MKAMMWTLRNLYRAASLCAILVALSGILIPFVLVGDALPWRNLSGWVMLVAAAWGYLVFAVPEISRQLGIDDLK